VKFLIKRRLPVVGLSLALSALVALYTVADGTGAAATTAVPVPRYSAVELADAILFHDGIAAEQLGGKAAGTEKLKTLESSVNGAINAKDITWQQSFADRIQSGDRIQIQMALADLGHLYRDLLVGKFGASKVDEAVHKAQQKFDQSDSPSSFSNVNVVDKINVVASAAAAALVLAVVVAGLVVVLVVVPFAPTKSAGGSGAKLLAEQYVDQLATSLRAA